MTKLKNTYTDTLPGLVNRQTGRIHTSYNQAVAATGRLSSSDPNLQNIPVRTDAGRRIREAFVPEAGCLFVSADYSQVELRVAAHLSGDPVLCRAFAEGRDVHAETAAEVFGVPREAVTRELRNQAKVINFGILYGMGAHRLSGELGITHRQAQDYIDLYFARLYRVRQWLDATLEEARKSGSVFTLLGRRRYVPDLSSQNHQTRTAAERVATNTPVQGTAADLIKVAMARIQSRLERERMASRMVLQVHDELLFECPESEIPSVAQLAREEMEGALTLSVPLKADVKTGRNWAEAH